MPEEKHITWEVHTHEHKERSNDWYWGFGAAAVVGAALSVWFGNALLAIILLLGIGSILYLATRGPRAHNIRIDSRGLVVDGTRYAYNRIISFWVERDQAQPYLFLSMNGILMPHLSLMLDSEAQGDEVRSHLRQFVDEVEQGPHFSDHLAEIFGL